LNSIKYLRELNESQTFHTQVVSVLNPELPQSVTEENPIPSTSYSDSISSKSTSLSETHVNSKEIITWRHIKSYDSFGQVKEWPLDYELPTFDSLLQHKLDSGDSLNNREVIQIVDTLYDQLTSFFW